jgi:hypothetical protein
MGELPAELVCVARLDHLLGILEHTNARTGDAYDTAAIVVPNVDSKTRVSQLDVYGVFSVVMHLTGSFRSR